MLLELLPAKQRLGPVQAGPRAQNLHWTFGKGRQEEAPRRLVERVGAEAEAPARGPATGPHEEAAFGRQVVDQIPGLRHGWNQSTTTRK